MKVRLKAGAFMPSEEAIKNHIHPGVRHLLDLYGLTDGKEYEVVRRGRLGQIAVINDRGEETSLLCGSRFTRVNTNGR